MKCVWSLVAMEMIPHNLSERLMYNGSVRERISAGGMVFLPLETPDEPMRHAGER